MITSGDLLRAKTQVEKSLEAPRKQLADAKAEFEKKAAELNAPFLELLEKYYDENLIDSNGIPVREGDVISIRGRKYRVVYRGMQTVLGIMMFNPSVSVVKAESDFCNTRIRPIHPDELKLFTKL